MDRNTDFIVSEPAAAIEITYGFGENVTENKVYASTTNQLTRMSFLSALEFSLDGVAKALRKLTN